MKRLWYILTCPICRNEWLNTHVFRTKPNYDIREEIRKSAKVKPNPNSEFHIHGDA
jgi:hypothetical protein